MGDALLRVAPALSHPGDAGRSPAPAMAANNPSYASFRAAATEYTPPASPQPQIPYAAKKGGFGSLRSRHPVQLQMDTTQEAPLRDRTRRSPTSGDSPTLPSQKFTQPKRTPSLLRHAAVPSPLHESHATPAPQPMSPIMAPAMARQDSNGPRSPDLRAIFNPLASNPIGSPGPAWNSPIDDMSVPPVSPLRARGMTSSSQGPFPPPLRSVTSIPDYAQYRGNERTNLSGTYKPNRGVPNWSHKDYYPPPPRPFRGEEPRSSFKSTWTTASSSILETSGTERSSIATARSSLASDRHPSIYSRDESRDRLRERDDSPETILTEEAAEEEDNLDAVGDVLDSYFYDEDDEERSPITEQHDRDFQSPSPPALDSEPPGLSQTPSRDFDSLDSFQSSESLKRWDERPSSRVGDSIDTNAEPNPNPKKPLTIRPPSGSDFDDEVLETESTNRKALQVDYMPKASPLKAPRTPKSNAVAPQQKKRQSVALQRSSEETPRRKSIALQALALRTMSSSDRANRTPAKGHNLKRSNTSQSQFDHIRRDISALPQLPMSRSRLSRQDWANIEAYSKRHSKRNSTRKGSNDSGVNRSGPLSPQSPPLQRSEALPEVDEDEAIPRRASTSVFDRKSAMFDLGMMSQLNAVKSKPDSVRSPTLAPPGQQMPTVTAQGLWKVAAPAERDRYGFKKASDKISVQEYNAWSSRYEEHIGRRRGKWIALMTKQGLSTTEPTKFPDMCEKVKRYARKGYPPEWRGAMWWYYSGGQHMIQQKEMVGLYKSLAARVNRGELNKDDKDAIERDLDRTFPDNIHFRPEAATDLLDGESDDEPALIHDLREVLSCFALNNPHIGYCQSLNFIAGLLLLFLKQDKEKAFILLTIITQNHLPGAHARSLANTEVNVLMMLIKDYLPKTVLRVWDAFLYEGPRALYRYALAIFKLGEPEIRKYRPGDGEIFMVVQTLPRQCLDPNILHDLAFVKKGFGNMSQNVIDQKRMFWREQTMIAHQNSVKKSATGRTQQSTAQTPEDEDGDRDSLRKAIGHGLRRRASRKFRKMGMK
ncbi:tbc domain-containing protein [Pyrenophora tritici-repentis]|nr:tbc domain-containing protein [Pyrenophora tritici-repentis]